MPPKIAGDNVVGCISSVFKIEIYENGDYMKMGTLQTYSLIIRLNPYSSAIIKPRDTKTLIEVNDIPISHRCGYFCYSYQVYRLTHPHFHEEKGLDR
jgi:hypothetical protein